jgi:hypothetical protein
MALALVLCNKATDELWGIDRWLTEQMNYWHSSIGMF